MPNNPVIPRLFGNIGLAVALNFLVKSAWILVNNIVQDRIGHSDFGTFTALYALGFLFIAFSDLGLNQYATRTLAGDPGRMKSLFPALFSIRIILSFLYPLLMTAVGWAIGYRGMELYWLVLLCMGQALVQTIFLFRAAFQSWQLFRMDGITSVIDRFILLGIIGVLLVMGKVTLDTYVWSTLVSVALAVVIVYIMAVRHFGPLRPRFSLPDSRHLLRDSFPFLLITILYSFNDKVDHVMLERIAGDHETGLYAGAYRWVDAAMMFLWTILPVFFARFARFARSEEEQKKLLHSGQVLTAIPMIFLSAFAWFHGERLLFLFRHSTPRELEVILACLRILFLSVMVNGVFAIFSTLLTSTGHEKFVGRMILISIIAGVSCNFFLIPRYGAWGPAWVTLGNYCFLSLSYVIYLTLRKPGMMPWGNMARIAIVALSAFAAFYFLKLTGVNWIPSTLAVGLLVLGITWFSGLMKNLSLRK